MDKNKKNIPQIDVFLKQILKQLIQVNFKKKDPLVLVNGLAEQYESWFFNVPFLTEHFTVHCPNLFLYQTEAFFSEFKKISVEWVEKRLETYLDSFAMTPPYHFVGSSAGCQTIARLAARRPEIVSKMILICPSGLGGEEYLPVVDGVSKRDLGTLISSIFHDKKSFVIDEIISVLKERFEDRRWRFGFVKMAQITKKNSVIPELLQIKCPILFICGEQDQIIPIWQAYDAAQKMRDSGADIRMIVINQCGHAPQIEKFQITNRFVADFLKGKLFSKNEKRRFWRQDGITFMPFDLDQAILKTNALRKKIEHPREKIALV